MKSPKSTSTLFILTGKRTKQINTNETIDKNTHNRKGSDIYNYHPTRKEKYKFFLVKGATSSVIGDGYNSNTPLLIGHFV